jgi:hypothetical protein
MWLSHANGMLLTIPATIDEKCILRSARGKRRAGVSYSYASANRKGAASP